MIEKTNPSDAVEERFLLKLNDTAESEIQPIIPELLESLLTTGLLDLETCANQRGWLLTSNVKIDLLKWYERILAQLTNLVVIQRFTAFRLVRNPLWRPKSAPPGDAPSSASRAMLDIYISWEHSEKLFIEDGPYPELGRLVRIARANWLAASIEMLQRVENHSSVFSELIGLRNPSLSSLTGVACGIGDLHDGGRSAAILSFEDRKVVYKPRSLGAEIGWQSICNGVLDRLGLSTYPLLIRDFETYGFMEYVTAVPCEDFEALQRCYQRYGAVLAVAHAIGTCDLHHENIIVHGEYPVVIDAEPLFRARLSMSEFGNTRIAFERNLSLDGLDVRESLMDLGILPIPMQARLPANQDEKLEEHWIGALCAYLREPARQLYPCDRGSDNLHMRYIYRQAVNFPNLPILNGDVKFPSEFIDDIVTGFELAHVFLRTNQEAYTGANGVLSNLGSARIRMLARATMDYATVLFRSLNPEPLRSTAARRSQIAADLEFLSNGRFDVVQELADQEVNSLLNCDIPRFEIGAHNLYYGETRLMMTPLDGALRQIMSLDVYDQNLQVTCIEENLIARHQKYKTQTADAIDVLNMERDGLTIIADLVAAVCAPSHAPYWVHSTWASGINATIVHADRESLYEGAAGIAILIAEGGRLIDLPEWGKLAVKVFDPILEGEPLQCITRSGGIARGLGGLIYSLLRVGDAANAPALLDAAVRIALEWGPSLAVNDALDEVLYGRAGLLLAILALHQRCPSVPLLAVADLAARTLLNRACHAETGVFWPVPGIKTIPNVSHGATGIAMSLARWARIRSDSAAAEVALSAITFDDRFWLEEEKGWRDVRLPTEGTKQHTTWTWCNGRSGALLARHAVADALQLSNPGPLVSAALHAETEDALLGFAPGLCCGTPGVVDSLLQIHNQEGREYLSALSRGIELLSSNISASYYSTLAPSLFQGTAGLGFALLRAAHSKKIKSILAFE